MKCDGCTLCCKLLSIPWMDSPAGEYCKECNPSLGCKIFENAPSKCLEYSCAYAQMERVSEKFRPDNCHVIFEKVQDKDIFIGLADPDYPISDEVKSQIRAFQQQGFSVSLSIFGQPVPMIFPAEGFSGEEIFKEVQQSLNSRVF